MPYLNALEMSIALIIRRYTNVLFTLLFNLHACSVPQQVELDIRSFIHKDKTMLFGRNYIFLSLCFYRSLKTHKFVVKTQDSGA